MKNWPLIGDSRHSCASAASRKGPRRPATSLAPRGPHAEPNAIVAPIHAKAMLFILKTQEEIDVWMTATTQEALSLQRPLPDDAQRIVARGKKSDSFPN